MTSIVNTINTPIRPFNAFKSSSKVKKAYLSYRYHNSTNVEPHTKLKAFIGSTLGVAVSMVTAAKKQKIKLSSPLDIFDLKYDIKDMVMISGAGIAGGVCGGMIGSDHKKQKMNEGVFQFMNSVVPLLFVHPATKMLNNVQGLRDNKTLKIATTLSALFLGMKAAAVISNYINDPNDEVPDRKLTMKDALANVDDAFGAFSIAKIPMADKVEKILPLIYVWCGYRAGQSN